jgi:hypothetical protein
MPEHRRRRILAKGADGLIPEGAPFFRFGEGANLLGLISGPLIFDSGEADNTFWFRCQERFLVYGALCGVRPILFVIDAAHREQLRRQTERLNEELDALGRRTGIAFPSVIDPFYAPLDVDTLQIQSAPWFEEQAMPARCALVFNQVSPAATRLVRELDGLMRGIGASLLEEGDLERLRRAGELALRFHDKSEYVRLLANQPGGLPRHARTLVVDVQEFLEFTGWESLRAVAARPGFHPEELYVKSSFDSGGNLAARIGPRDAATKLPELQQELSARGGALEQLRRDIELSPGVGTICWDTERLRGFLDGQRNRRGALRVLLQECVDSREPADLRSIGITCQVETGAAFATAQIYSDPELRHFMGAWVSDAISARVLGPALTREVKALSRKFCEEGYFGPIEFDARLSADGEWTMIYDCNPRLTAVFPALSVFQLLRRTRLCKSVISSGYRGEWSQYGVNNCVDRLERSGLLYGQQGQGALPLPNAAREGGCDLLFVNMPPAEVPRLLDSAGLRSTYFQEIFF